MLSWVRLRGIKAHLIQGRIYHGANGGRRTGLHQFHEIKESLPQGQRNWRPVEIVLHKLTELIQNSVG